MDQANNVKCLKSPSMLVARTRTKAKPSASWDALSCSPTFSHFFKDKSAFKEIFKDFYNHD